jgi:heme-degrading monooxygenase HmoA
MTVVKISAITVAADRSDELGRRFAAWPGAGSHDGFEGFELFKPADQRTTWLMITRWRDEGSWRAWAARARVPESHHPATEPGRPAWLGRDQQRAMVLPGRGRIGPVRRRLGKSAGQAACLTPVSCPHPRLPRTDLPDPHR